MEKNNMEKDNQLPFGHNLGLTIPQGDAGDRFKDILQNIGHAGSGREFTFFHENRLITKPAEDANKSVTITLSKRNYNRQPFDLGTTVRGGKTIRKSLISNPRAKAKMLAAKLRRKVWHPLFKITTVDNTQPYQHTFTLKSFNF